MGLESLIAAESMVARPRLKRGEVLMMGRFPAHQDEHRIQHKIEQRPLRARHIVDRNAR
jgi:hypothetical protein